MLKEKSEVLCGRMNAMIELSGMRQNCCRNGNTLEIIRSKRGWLIVLKIMLGSMRKAERPQAGGLCHYFFVSLLLFFKLVLRLK